MLTAINIVLLSFLLSYLFFTSHFTTAAFIPLLFNYLFMAFGEHQLAGLACFTATNKNLITVMTLNFIYFHSNCTFYFLNT